MEKTDFAVMVERLSAYFDRKEPRDGVFAEWFLECQRIPVDAITYIEQGIKTMESFPKNFCQCVWKLYRDWLSVNPDRHEIVAKGCDRCSHGFFTVSRKDGDNWYNTALKCAHCNANGHPQAAPAWTWRQVLVADKWFRPVGPPTHHYHAQLPPHNAQPVKEWAELKATHPNGIIATLTERFSHDKAI